MKVYIEAQNENDRPLIESNEPVEADEERQIGFNQDMVE